MIVNFNEDYLRDLYRSGKSDKKHRFQPQIVRKYIRVIDLMISEDNVQGLWKYNSLNYERLEGNKEGLSSVRVNDQYRIEFEEEFEDGQTIATICNITELSNHINEIVMSNNKKTIKEMRANDMTPFFPTHPGDVLKNEIEYRGISQRQLAEEMGIAYSAMNEILNARRPVTEKTALLFEAALGVNAEPLLKMQMRYNLQSTKNDSTFMARLAKVRRVAAAL